MTDRRRKKFVNERYLYLAMVGVAALAAIWVQFGVSELREANNRRAQQLTRFLSLRDETANVSSNLVVRMVPELNRRLHEFDWFQNLNGVQPRVVVTGAGLTIQLVENDGSEARPR